ncbi:MULTISPECIES: PQQ-binding-like beta-propeller repeat protein [Actinomadura]|uniref:PQQ-binding-like beta-propeller repeat protein n=1 Tax=Actinomadura litoris TaxID=2678616 RepID=A0A7K1KYM8_9ACTN|nr:MULTISPECIES: PQQ-binding-like beta-propeller repeat protein [Actinomadura]MBT2209030.1 PQQ-binding-like beta-propeller repeat protein [Actinomadura sp. NEAU-AAG7]MUN37153.1 PQQ-binding-like beta-propeller repeat protein [Actinomadura litoris]
MHPIGRGRLLKAAAVIAAGCLAVASSVTSASGRPMSGDWPTWQKDTYGSRFNAQERQINAKNVGGLKLKWAFGFPRQAGAPHSQPAVVGDTIYFGGPDGQFRALNARTGAPKWSFDLSTVGTGFTQVRDGASVAEGHVYFGDTRGYIYSLDQRTGKLDWAQRVENHVSATVTSSPIVFRGRVYVGVSSGENLMGKEHACCTFRGQVNALNARTGKIDWKFYTVPEPKQDGTWPNGVPRYGPSGAGVWSTPAIDPETRTLYVGTGQNYSGSGGHFDSVLALDTDTGKERWTRKMTDVDTWRRECSSQSPEDQKYCPNLPDGTALDFDLGAAPNLFTAGGKRLIGIGQKLGVYHVLDATTGKIVWQRQLSQPMPGGGLSGIQWGSSYDGQRLYVATYMGNPGTLFALDPATGHVIWNTPNPADGCTTGGAAQYPKVCRLGHPPAVTTTPGLVWEGSMDGKLRAYSAEDGKVLWAFDTIADFPTVNGGVGRGGSLAGGGGAVVSQGMVYALTGDMFTPYPNDKGSVLLAFGRE